MLLNTRKTLCFLSAIGVNNNTFQVYIKKSGRRYASFQMLELTTTAFKAIQNLECFPTTIGSHYTSRQLEDLTTLAVKVT